MKTLELNNLDIPKNSVISGNIVLEGAIQDLINSTCTITFPNNYIIETYYNALLGGYCIEVVGKDNKGSYSSILCANINLLEKHLQNLIDMFGGEK